MAVLRCQIAPSIVQRLKFRLRLTSITSGKERRECGSLSTARIMMLSGAPGASASAGTRTPPKSPACSASGCSACGSTGWVYSITSKYHIFLGMFPPAAQDEVWGEDPRAVTAASFTPAGTAAPADGGYLLSGKWMFCSGVDHCPWIVVATTVPGAGDGPGAKGYPRRRPRARPQ